jgi:hypothetical protein
VQGCRSGFQRAARPDPGDTLQLDLAGVQLVSPRDAECPLANPFTTSTICATSAESMVRCLEGSCTQGSVSL